MSADQNNFIILPLFILFYLHESLLSFWHCVRGKKEEERRKWILLLNPKLFEVWDIYLLAKFINEKPIKDS